ncbi:hypothetical protein [Pontibacter sp. G13]|uniref:LolA family protein n=1 Tax=Pontibacter sp. G13 TaxID=3074898 RepID=UPI00288A00EA|nr:hypothetical protein [Pontibacter sp. G13]WNJ20776.1 hypothetical protein RJD25_09860 [Pontibacter sp. G13]
MKFFKNWVLNLSLLVLSLFSLAFSDQDEKAEILLRNSQAMLTNLEDLTARFQYEIVPTGKTAPVSLVGELSYKKGKYVINLNEHNIYNDLETEWLIIPEQNLAIANSYIPGESVNLVEYIYRVFDSPASSSYQGMVEQEGRQFHKIYLTMDPNFSSYRQAYVWIDAETKFPVKYAFVDARQVVTTYTFSEIRVNLGLVDSMFSFDPSADPNLEIQDQR